MTKEELAYLLNGREYREEITREESKQAKESGLVVLFGASDDLLKIRGAAYDEVSAWDGNSFLIKRGKIEEDNTKVQLADNLYIESMDVENVGKCSLGEPSEGSNRVDVIWSPAKSESSWLITSKIPHSSFDIMEDEEVYCTGIVFDVKDIKPINYHGYTPEQQEYVCCAVHKWMVKHNCHSAEHASQDDTCIVDAIDLVCELAEIVGIPYKDEND